MVSMAIPAIPKIRDLHDGQASVLCNGDAVGRVYLDGLTWWYRHWSGQLVRVGTFPDAIPDPLRPDAVPGPVSRTVRGWFRDGQMLA